MQILATFVPRKSDGYSDDFQPKKNNDARKKQLLTTDFKHTTLHIAFIKEK